MTDYPSNWSEIRERVFRRDGYRCRRCGARGQQRGGRATLHAHHVVPKSAGGSHDPSNLVTRCGDCHAGDHENPELSRRTRRAKSGARSLRRPSGRR